jgi:chitinase
MTPFLGAMDAPSLLSGRATDDDYTCGPDRPCANKACCPKATLSCNYGEEACGTSGISPNEVCWSNCDAKSECGRDAKVPGQKCPLNVCCGKWGFCGMTEDYCDKKDHGATGGCRKSISFVYPPFLAASGVIGSLFAPETARLLPNCSQKHPQEE